MARMTNNEHLNGIALMQYLDEPSFSQMQRKGLEVKGNLVTYKKHCYVVTSSPTNLTPLSTQEVEDGIQTYSIITKYIYKLK